MRGRGRGEGEGERRGGGGRGRGSVPVVSQHPFIGTGTLEVGSYTSLSQR